MGGRPKPTGKVPKAKVISSSTRKNPFKQRMHASKPWKPKGRSKVVSKLSNEAKVADVPAPKLKKGAGYNDSTGYRSPSANLKGYT